MKDFYFHSVNILSCKNEAGQSRKECGRSLVSLETTHSRETEEKRLRSSRVIPMMQLNLESTNISV